jgi:small membrane protein
VEQYQNIPRSGHLQIIRMNGIQLLLIFGISILGIYYVIRLRKTMLDLTLIIVLMATAVTFILWPDLTNKIANKLGVGRGADLLYYVCILLFSFALLKLYSRLRRLEQQFTRLIREDALKNAKQLEDQ